MDLKGFDLLRERQGKNLKRFPPRSSPNFSAPPGLLKSHQELLFPHCEDGGGPKAEIFGVLGLGFHHDLMHGKTLLSGLG